MAGSEDILKEIEKARDCIAKEDEKTAIELLLYRMTCGNGGGCLDCKLDTFAKQHHIHHCNTTDCRLVSYGLMVHLANAAPTKEGKETIEALRSIVAGNKPKRKRKPINDGKPTDRCTGTCKECANRGTGSEDWWLFCSHFHNFVKPDGFCSEFKPEQREGE